MRGDGSQHSTSQDAVVHLGIVDDRLRDVLYHHAVAVLAPSRFEGFGLVPLEALAAGAWVIASAIPAHREVLDDCAVFFDPDMRSAALTEIKRAARASAGERAERAERGRKRAGEFSVDRAADAFEESLQRAGLL